MNLSSINEAIEGTTESHSKKKAPNGQNRNRLHIIGVEVQTGDWAQRNNPQFFSVKTFILARWSCQEPFIVCMKYALLQLRDEANSYYVNLVFFSQLKAPYKFVSRPLA